MPLTQVSSRGIEDTLRYVLGASGTDHYTFTGKGLTGAVNDPTLTLSRGHTYIFENRSGGHPFYIKTSIANGGTNDAYNTGVTNNGGAGGTEIVFTVPHDAPDLLYYQCSSHSNMAGQLKIAGAVADGSITTAKIANNAVTNAQLGDSSVTTAKIAAENVATSSIANNAVTTAKIADSTSNTDGITTAKIATGAITTAKLATDAVDNSKLADQAVTLDKLPHGDASNDGKFLRANNGADPSFETVSIPAGTTINSNANNRVITGDANANTLNAESSVVVDDNGNLGVGTTTPKNNSGYGGFTLDGSSGSLLSLLQNGTENLRIFGDSNPALQFEGVLRLFSGVSGGSAIWGISPNGTTTGQNSVTFNLKSTIQHTVGVVSISSSYNSGDLYVRIDNLMALSGNAWWTFSFLLLSNQVQGGLGGHHSYVTSLNITGLSSWSSISTTNIVGSCSASVSQHGTNFVEVQFDFNNSSRGANTIICNGGTFDPPRISFH